MKKLVSLVLVGVLGSVLFAGIVEDEQHKKGTKIYAESELVTKAFKKLINEEAGNRNARSMGRTKALSDYLNTKIGTLNSNILNLQLPTATATVANDWQGLFFKLQQYIDSAETQEEYYFRRYQYASVLLPESEILWGAIATTLLEQGSDADEMFRFALTSKSKAVAQNSIINTIIFIQLIDISSNDTFSKKHFKDNGLQAEWDRVRGELKL